MKKKSVVNLTSHSVLFNAEGVSLTKLVRRAFHLAMDSHLKAVGLENILLDTVTTKTNRPAAFAKFVTGRVLSNPDRQFDELYIERVFEAYKSGEGHFTKELFDFVLFADPSGSYSFKKTYALAVRVPLGIFLVALHSTGAITLPGTFNWPSLRTGKADGQRRLEVGKNVASELLKFIRSLDSQQENFTHPAFEAIGGDRARREWFLSYATKLLLATGWHNAEDANIEDLARIKLAERDINPHNFVPFAYSALLDVLNLAFPGRIRISSDDWSKANRTALSRSFRQTGRVAQSVHHLLQTGPREDFDLLEEILPINASWGKPERMRSITRLPGLSTKVGSLSKIWLDLEDLYVKKVARESYKHFYNAVGWWNIYLFFYLPYWFGRNPKNSWPFPSSPSKLVRSVFVSRLLPIDEPTPATFIEFMSAQAERRAWLDNTFYATLLQLQNFFTFVERYSDEIPGCAGFTQPLSQDDFPPSTRALVSNKQPVPHRLFRILLDYYEALLAYHKVVSDGVLMGSISNETLKKVQANGNIIDTFAASGAVGFIPVLFAQAKTVPLQIIPNLLDVRQKTLCDGRTRWLPHPHALHQNLVALHTGIRHNHIQWLDRDKFDVLVTEDDQDFSMLWVNTDKQKREPWTPHVNHRVIEILRDQRQWCELIDGSSFHAEHYYNNNPRTKWPKFRPLFACAKDGLPHLDDVYSEMWKSVLAGLEGIYPLLLDSMSYRRMVHLMPPGFDPWEPGGRDKLVKYGNSFTKKGGSCPLRLYTSSTAHSARVTVVSQYITFLPLELIGKYVTGQKKGTVSYYVHIDPDALEVQRVHQAARMREAALKAVFDPILNGASSTTFVHADNVNSNLARSLKTNLEETFIVHGGMCIAFGERTRLGMDVLRETACADIAFNKTEVCPYGNNCPPEIVKDLKGIRRCSLCPYAVRFIDHLPAVLAKKRQVADDIDALETVLAVDAKTLNAKYSQLELDALEADRARLCEDLCGWILSEEVLEVIRQRVKEGQETRTWTVQRPAIIEQKLQKISVQTTESEYLLARLGECIAFPALESQQMHARFDLLLRELLARAGNLRESFSMVSVDPAAECAGMLKAIAESRGLTLSQIADLLDDASYIQQLPKTELRLLSDEGLT